MEKEQYQKNLDFFREILKIEVNSGVRFFNSNMHYMQNEKQKKLVLDAYTNSKDKCNAISWASMLNEQQQNHLKILLQLYISESFRYFFRRLEEGENNHDMQRMNFQLKMINKGTKEETILIDSTDDSNIDNDFQTWIMDYCSHLPKTE